jgi:hypothetical protein
LLTIEPRAQLGLDRVRVGGERATEVHDQLVELVERGLVGVLSLVDQDAAEERRADVAVVLHGDRVAEQVRAPLPEDRHHPVVERIPLQQRVERGRAVLERRDPGHGVDHAKRWAPTSVAATSGTPGR